MKNNFETLLIVIIFILSLLGYKRELHFREVLVKVKTQDSIIESYNHYYNKQFKTQQNVK